MSTQHPLDRYLDVSSEDSLDDEIELITAPSAEDASLDTIIEFALKAYTEQMNDMVHIEPKNRIRFLEVAEKFLDQAKDAIAKKEQLNLAREKHLDMLRSKKSPSSGTAGGDTGTSEEKGRSRTELADMIAAAKNAKSQA